MDGYEKTSRWMTERRRDQDRWLKEMDGCEMRNVWEM
jgi:hypothetical protein